MKRACFLLIAGLALLSTACEQAAIISQAVNGPPKIDPLYILPDAPTLVLVDDPRNLLNNPGLARQIASTATHYLTFNEVLEESSFIDARKVVRLEAELGDDWGRTPIDEIGRRLGAEQVIYAKVKNVQLHFAGRLYRPEASIEVKVISTADGQRLWPEASELANPDRPPPGHTVSIKEHFVSRDSRYVGDSTPDDLARQMADDAGLLIARLFYQWQADPVGSSL